MEKQRICLYFFVILLSQSCAQKVDKSIKTPLINSFSEELVVDGLQNPWGMAFPSKNSILLTEKSGELIFFENGKKKTITNLPDIYQRGQGGLLDVELHPNYASNGWIYLSFSSSEGEGKGGNTSIMRAKIKVGKLTEKKILYKAVPNTTKGQHWGSRLEFDEEGFLYFSIGDRGNRDENPQDITRDGGKIYRIHDDGRIPKDNPFVNENGAKKAIYSYGHRNPQGLIKNPFTKELWEHEHGPRGGDEINIIKKGENYGWPLVTYGINYVGTKITDKTSSPGTKGPLYQWTPSIAPSGMTFVNSDKYPDWKGNLLVGSLAFHYLERLEFKDNEVIYREKLLDGLGRVRNVKQGPDGYIYVAVEGKGIYRLNPKKQ